MVSAPTNTRLHSKSARRPSDESWEPAPVLGRDVGAWPDAGTWAAEAIGVVFTDASAVFVAAGAAVAVSVAAAIAVCVGAGSVADRVAVAVSVAAAIAVCVAGGIVAVGTAVAPRVAVGCGAAAVGVALGVAVADPFAHSAEPMLLVSSVTAPLRANARPDTPAPVFSVMLVSARILPLNAVVVPIVALDPICQYTLHGEPPLMITTDEPLAVVSALPILKTKTASALPCALSVSAPVNCAEEEKQ